MPKQTTHQRTRGFPVQHSPHLGKARLLQKEAVSTMVQWVREQEGLSQRQLATVAGVPQPAIARMESTASPVLPGIDALARILHAAGYQLDLQIRKRKGSK